MSRILEYTEYCFEIELPEDFEANHEFWDIFPIGLETDFCDTCFTCHGFEWESSAEKALESVEALIEQRSKL